MMDSAEISRMVVVDPEIMGGTPVFRGTRLPVHQIAELLAMGETVEDLLASYPSLTPEMVTLAPALVEALPPYEAPPPPPWRDRPPIRTWRVKIGVSTPA